MLKSEQVVTKAPKGPPVELPPEAPAGPPQRCVLCGKPCHVKAVPYSDPPHEVQDCRECGRSRRNPAVARKAFA